MGVKCVGKDEGVSISRKSWEIRYKAMILRKAEVRSEVGGFAAQV